GAVDESSIFYGKSVVRHGWIECDDGSLVDPTRWVFEGAEPYIYFGRPSREYDEGANRLRACFARPAPIFDPLKTMVVIPGRVESEVFASLLGMDVVRSEINVEQAFWIGNLTLDALGVYANMVYQALEKMGLKVFVPIDNYMKVVNFKSVK
ncbi:hypothetical protein, partial [Paracidovorax wautersii]|uniref:hypothetical protein n=1 Tax=Paracidovorax wautersii TaxID=1177982 RepID=UPI001C3147C2